MNDVLLESTIRSTVIVSAAWAAAWFLRRASADLRHKIWLAALIGIACSWIAVPGPESFRLVITAQSGGAADLTASSRWPIALAAMWIAGVTLLLGRKGIGLVRLARITNQARRAGSEEFLVSDSVMTPMTWGVRRPVIILPAYVADWPEDKRDAVMLHEQAHVARRDWMWQTFAQVVAAVFWFHPLAWLAAFQLRQEAERAADDRVLAKGIDAAEYAGRLMEVARRLRGTISQEATAMVRAPVLASRITAILDVTQSRARSSRSSRVAIAVLSLLLAVSLAAAQKQRVYTVAEVSDPPRVASKIEPKYTAKARAAKIEGTVELKMVIKPDGRAANIHVARSLDKGLDANAVSAIKKWSFEPGKKDGERVPVSATIEVNFRLL
jgi:TonB family protein